MDSRHKDAYAEHEIFAYKTIAELKWNKKYHCRKCKGTRYYEGRTPFSRRCTLCKDEESVTANTVFDKTRIPLAVGLYLIELLSTNKCRLTFPDYASSVNKKFDYKLTPKGIRHFLSKVLIAMKNPVPKFSGNVTVIIHKHRNARIITVFNKKKYYSQPIKSTGTGGYKKQDIDNILKKIASENSQVSIKPLDKFVSDKKGLVVTKPNKRSLLAEENLPYLALISEIEGHIYGIHYAGTRENLQPGLDYFMFFKNGFTHKDLMNRLTKDYTKYKSSTEVI